MPHSPVPETSLTPEQRELLRTRYGTARTPHLLLIIALSVTALAFVCWVVWAAFGQADQDVRWQTVGYSDVSDESVTIKFDVFKPVDQDVVCVVRALDLDSQEVGRADVPITSGEADVNVTYTLQVTDTPTTAEVLTCRLRSSEQ